jgi:ferredoxin like protein
VNNPRTIQDRLGFVGYRNQGRSNPKPHILVDTEICNTRCPHRATHFVCPARCYTIDEDNHVHFQFEDCIECGACLHACDQGAVTWRFPDPEEGRGVTWRMG